MMLAAASTDDVAFVQQHTTSTTKLIRPRLVQTKQVHAAAGPVCTVAPSVTGTLTVGQVQTCAPGTWLNSPAFTYQWRRRNVGDIFGATAATYTLTAADSGLQVECMVTGTNVGGASTARSNFVSVP
jgi:hypothetical protein